MHQSPRILQILPPRVDHYSLCDEISTSYLVSCVHKQRPNNTPEEYVLIGDSHAEVLASGDNIPQSITSSQSIIAFPASGVERFLDQTSSPFGSSDGRKLPAFIKNLRNNPPAHHRTILLAGRLPP
jgi:hypothetical protein